MADSVLLSGGKHIWRTPAAAFLSYRGNGLVSAAGKQQNMPKVVAFKPENRLHELRKERDMTLQQVADELKISVAQVQRLEKNYRQIKLDTLRAFSRIFCVQPADLLLGSDGGLSREERRIIDFLRSADPQAAAGIHGHVDALRQFAETAAAQPSLKLG